MLGIQVRVGIQVLAGYDAAFPAVVKTPVLAALGNMASPIKGVAHSLDTAPATVEILKGTSTAN